MSQDSFAFSVCLLLRVPFSRPTILPFANFANHAFIFFLFLLSYSLNSSANPVSLMKTTAVVEQNNCGDCDHPNIRTGRGRSRFEFAPCFFESIFCYYAVMGSDMYLVWTGS
jgi:hypothetical protein